MPLMSLIYLLKNLDAANAANARIMDKGTDRNILTQLCMTSNDFNFVTTLYYVSIAMRRDVWVMAYALTRFRISLLKHLPISW